VRNRNITTIALVIVAALAMSVAAAATASAKTAMPEIVNKEGKTPTKTSFTSTSGASTLETLSGNAVKCTADTDKGKLTGPSSDETEVKFTGCSASFGLKCETGSTSGEIVLKANSELVWLNKAEETEPGEDLSLPSNLTIKCTALETLTVKGSTICAISPFKTLSKTGTITCKQAKGKQEPSVYFLEGKEVKDITETEGSGLESFKFEQSGLASTDSLTYEEEVEII
jgi:hypothetical protein